MNFYKKLLEIMNLSDEQYNLLTKKISLDDIEDPLNFQNIDTASKRIKNAINNHEKIMIYGDYDCDGICSVSILVKTFKMLNYEVGYYIPSRYKDGYGINEKMVDLIHSKGYTLIITVDNGVSQHEALKKAKEYGIDVILTDHHEILHDIPDCYCIVHPFLKNKDNMPQCGAYVSFMLSIKLLDRIDNYLLSLASLATISDMMPLIHHNRNLVRLALEVIPQERFPQFLILLDNRFEDEKSLSFVLAPKINALGRVKEDNSVNKVVKYFVSNSEKEIVDLANVINSINDERKRITLDAFNSLNIDTIDNVIVTYIPNLKEGLIGLVAARILNQYSRPCIVFSKSENGLLKGSGRSLEGFSLAESFHKLDSLIEVYGGHALAGGLSIKEENLEIFTKEINKLCENVVIKEKEKKIIEMDQDDFNFDNCMLIKNLSPYGEGFDEPYLSYEIKSSNISLIGVNKQHAKGFINEKCSFIHFNIDKELLNKEYIKLIGRLEIDQYRGNKCVTFNVTEIK